MKYYLVYLLFFMQLLCMSQESARTLIESGVEAMIEKDHEKSLGLLVKAKTLAEENKNYEDLFLAINNIGANYYSMLDYGEALSNYLQAYQIAIEHLQPIREMSVLNNIAILYSKEENYNKAEEYFRKAYAIADKNNDIEKKGLYAINLGAVLNEKGDLINAENFLKEAKQTFSNDEKMLLEANLILSNNLMLRGRYNEAVELSFKLEPLLVGKEYEEHRVSNYLIISKAFQREKNFTEALLYAKKGLNESLNLENKIYVYEQLANLHIEQNMLQEALQAKDSLIKAESEFNNIKNGRLYENNRVKFEIQGYQKELQYQEEKIKNKEKQFLILLIGSGLIIVVFIWALKSAYVRSKQKKILHEKSEKLISLELEKEKTKKLLLEKQLKEKEAISLLEHEKLKNEIEARNRKLSAKALYLSNRNDLISTIINDLDRIYHVKRDGEIRVHIHNLRRLLKAEDEWDSFIKHFEEVNHMFVNNLKQEFSTLNSNDIRFLSYVYMNLSSKEISSIFNITLEACRKRKERVSKKLGLMASSNLYDYLYKFN